MENYFRYLVLLRSIISVADLTQSYTKSATLIMDQKE
jgi:hypothetical protein